MRRLRSLHERIHERLNEGVLHDLRGLFMVVQLCSEELGARADAAQRACIDDIQQAMVRANELVSGLMSSADAELTQPETTDLGEVLGELCQRLGRKRGAGPEVSLEIAENCGAVSLTRAAVRWVALGLVELCTRPTVRALRMVAGNYDASNPWGLAVPTTSNAYCLLGVFCDEASSVRRDGARDTRSPSTSAPAEFREFLDMLAELGARWVEPSPGPAGVALWVALPAGRCCQGS